MTPSAATRFRELIATRLAGRKIDLVCFVDELLGLARETGAVSCRLVGEDRLHVTLGDQSWEVELPAARAKLRMLCARLSVLCAEMPQRADFAYGGAGSIPAPGAPAEWLKLDFTNTPGDHVFRLTTSQPDPCAAPMQTTRPLGFETL